MPPPVFAALQATVLFGLGILVVTVQLATRLACSKVANVSVAGYSLGDVCITVPTTGTTRAGERQGRTGLLSRRAAALN